MRTASIHAAIEVTALCLAVSISLGATGQSLSALEVKPSANAGRLGQYTATTCTEGYNYHVYVPGSYSTTNPAGIHLYLCGQGSCAANDSFHYSVKTFLEPHNLIGINMQFLDGNNAKDAKGKLHATRFAVAQVQADYKIIAGRGAIGSFSGGGVIHSMYWAMNASKKAPDKAWPFVHHTLSSSNWRVRIDRKSYMSWFLGAGNRKRDNVWTTMTMVAKMLLDSGNPDTYLKIVKEKGHGLWYADWIDSAHCFHRTDLVQAPFLYESDWPDPELRLIVKSANAHELGAAVRAIQKLEHEAETGDALRGRVQELRIWVERRIAALITLSSDLLADDAILSKHYLPLILEQLRGHPAAEELKQRFAQTAASEEYKNALEQQTRFTGDFLELMDRTDGKVIPNYIPFLETCVETAGEEALLGKMSKDFLECE